MRRIPGLTSVCVCTPPCPPADQVAAKKLGLNATAMVMLQIVGGAAGQVCACSWRQEAAEALMALACAGGTLKDVPWRRTRQEY